MAILTPVPNTLANNTVADATLVMANFNAIVAGVNAGAAESGNNASITALLGLTTPISAAQGGTQLFSAGTAGGTANALTVTTVTPSTGFVYQAGATVVFTAGLTNSGPATAAVNGTTATAINFNNNSGLSPLVGGELILGARVVMTLATNSGPWVIQNFVGGYVPSPTGFAKAVNTAKGAAVASAATTDVWTPQDGNLLHITGTATITSFGTASQAGAWRWVIADAAFTITNNANIVVAGAANYTTAAGDRLLIFADTTTVAYVSIFKANGASIAASSVPVMHRSVLTAGVTWTTNANHKWVTVTVIGGGGAGGGSGNNAGAAAGGGGAGGVAIRTYTNLTPNTAYTIAVAAAGGNSTFTDGTNPIAGNGGGGGTSGSANNPALGGIGGTATGGDINIAGQAGLNGTGNSTNTTSVSGAGGSTLYGSGGKQLNNVNAAGAAGTGYGSGSSGSLQSGTTTNGQPGAIIIEEWY